MVLVLTVTIGTSSVDVGVMVGLSVIVGVRVRVGLSVSVRVGMGTSGGGAWTSPSAAGGLKAFSAATVPAIRVCSVSSEVEGRLHPLKVNRVRMISNIKVKDLVFITTFQISILLTYSRMLKLTV